MLKEIWIKNSIGKVLEPAGFSYMGRWEGEKRGRHINIPKKNKK